MMLTGLFSNFRATSASQMRIVAVTAAIAFTGAFLLLCIFHAALFGAAMRLPQSVEGTNEQPRASPSVTLESVSE